MTPSPETLERAFARLPSHGRGQRIGLFGGSFDPVHAGHLLVAETALRRARLDAVWWLVTPGNPLKDLRDLAPRNERLAAVRRMAAHPRMIAIDLEARLGTRFTVDLIEALKARAPSVRFVWVTGADGLADLHRWRGWRGIMRSVPICAVDRPGATFRAVSGRAATAYAARRIDAADARCLASSPAPAWVLLHGPRSSLSSTALRGETGRSGA